MKQPTSPRAPLARAMRSALPPRKENPMSDEARSVDKPTNEAPDAGKAYDPSMTDTDEANLPPDSKADPTRDPQTQERDEPAE
jgi:hypothetical protein